MLNGVLGYEIHGTDGSTQCIKDTFDPQDGVAFVDTQTNGISIGPCGFTGTVVAGYPYDIILLI